jgi:glycosyltransferase involved in cell wall biosynthesis
MPSPTLSLCMIVRNVGRYIENALRSVVPHVNEIIIVDTASEDDSKAVIRRVAPHAKILDFTPQTHPAGFMLDAAETWGGDISGPFTGKHMLADFGGARQLGWTQATGDYVMWLDADDVLQHGENLPQLLAEMAANGVDYALINYDYSFDGRGNVNLGLRRERIVRRSFGSRWQQPVHEVLVPMGVGVPYAPDVLNVIHKRGEYGDTHGIAHRNLKILYRWLKANEKNKDRDPRMLFYLGMEERGFWPDRAIEHFNEYCQRSGWDEERGVAHVQCGRLHEKGGRLVEAFAEYSQGHIEFPWNPDALFGCARVAYTKRDWGKVIEYTERAFKVRDEPNSARRVTIMWNPLDWHFWPIIQYSAALIETGQNERVIAVCEEALKLADDPFIKGNLESARNNLRIVAERAAKGGVPEGKIPFNLRRDAPLDAAPPELATDVLVAFAIQTLWRRALDEQPAKALTLLDSLPAVAVGHERVRAAREFTLARLTGAPAPAASAPAAVDAVMARAADATRELRAQQDVGRPGAVDQTVYGAPSNPNARQGSTLVSLFKELGEEDSLRAATRAKLAADKLDIVCWTGPGWEEWNPADAIAHGLGGSELAAVYLMRELAKRGHRVRVIGHPGSKAGMYDGVEYIHFEDHAKTHQCLKPDVLIVSRAPQAFLDGYEAKANFLWVHDIHVGEPVGRNMEGIMRADRIFCLSQWHKGFFLQEYPFLHPDTIIVTRNGIDPGRFAKEPVKQGKRLIWTSTPHRGVNQLLDLLPAIRAEVPETELHVYYGFTTWERIAHARSNHDELTQIARLKQRLTSTPGVTFHDRKGQQELADAFSASSVWAYPTWFTETSCITAMEAQAAGCVPVATKLAALGETVKHGILLEPPNTTPEYARDFVSNVVRLLRDEPARRQLADAGRAWALANLGWDRLAVEWETIFHKTIAAKTGAPLPSYGNI